MSPKLIQVKRFFFKKVMREIFIHTYAAGEKSLKPEIVKQLPVGPSVGAGGI